MILNKFVFVKSVDRNVILYDANRNIFINLNEKELFWSKTANDIYQKINNGRWIFFQTS